MAKKRFTDDLFGLFEEPAAPAEPAARPAGEEEPVEVTVPVATPTAKKKLASKGFTQDLDDFLGDSFNRERRGGARRGRGRKSGLDFLIRSTVDPADEDRAPQTGPPAPETKRVTLIFNKAHLAELKQQAKERRMYLKDVVQEMVADYLAEQG